MLLCEASGCSNGVHARGLCFKHYMRVSRTGTVERLSDGVGSRRRHPLYEAWKSMHRAAARRGGCDPRWDEFWDFLADVGTRPDGHRLRRKDQTHPYSKTNCEWRPPVFGDQETRESRAAYMRAYNLKRPDGVKSAQLKRDYGISLKRYREMHAAQGGVCFICGKPETNMTKDGKPRMLAVDHDHRTGAVRKLLCTHCNTLIGLARDDIGRLRAAIAYLETH